MQSETDFFECVMANNNLELLKQNLTKVSMVFCFDSTISERLIQN